MTAVAASPAPPSNMWWLILLQGIATIVLGLLLLADPAMATTSLVIFLGIYWLVDGMFSFVRMFMKNTGVHWAWMLLRGILGVVVGLAVLQHPLWSAILVPATLVLLLSIQAIISGCIGIYHSFKGGGWSPAVLGVINILIGIFLWNNILAATVSLPVVLGFFATIGGIMLLVMAFRVKSGAMPA